jgi:hypothetical protein
MSQFMPMRPDRRTFLGQMTLTVGGAAVASILPVSLLQARPTGPVCAYHDPCGDWNVDDMCAAYPPYAFRIDAGVPRHAPMTARVEPIDQMWAG